MLAERKAARIALTPPERATLVAHAKLWLFQQLVDSQVPEHPFVAPALIRYFPRNWGSDFTPTWLGILSREKSSRPRSRMGWSTESVVHSSIAYRRRQGLRPQRWRMRT